MLVFAEGGRKLFHGYVTLSVVSWFEYVRWRKPLFRKQLTDHSSLEQFYCSVDPVHLHFSPHGKTSFDLQIFTPLIILTYCNYMDLHIISFAYYNW
jgi:hypothetical protein